MNATTCQICGREIKSKSGVIAHHGYRRPKNWGSQTASCPGARCLPYEVSCDRIGPLIKEYESDLVGVRTQWESFVSNPPDKLEDINPYNPTIRHEAVRPKNFNSRKRTWEIPFFYSYEQMFQTRVDRFERNIREIQAEIKYLTERLENWHRAHPDVPADKVTI